MKRITLEESNKYISLEDDFTNKTIQDCPFFTLTPSPRGDGWENVTYFTARKKSMYQNRDGNYDSWVYILSNPTMPNMYKIGYTKNTPDERAKQISSSTGVAMPYKVEWAFHCYDGYGLEQEVHHKLNSCRVNGNREFFEISLEEAQQIVETLGKRYI